MNLHIKEPWFKESGLGYLPINIAGVLVAAMVLLFDCLYFMAVDKHSETTTDSILHFFVGFTCAAFWYQWIAKRTS